MTTVRVDDVVEIIGAKVFWAIYDENGYTGNAEEYPGESNNINRIISDGYKPRYFKTYNNFPRNFIPKKDTPYLCLPKLTKQWDKGRTTYNRVSLLNPIELIYHEEYTILSNGEKFYYGGPSGKWVRALCKEKGMVASGYISLDGRTVYTTKPEDSHLVHPHVFEDEMSE
ncbi:hypothetical protein LAV82_23705 [Bacillus sp. ILBB4]|nr:hypothetical protein [Bacillus sp. ILBB4]